MAEDVTVELICHRWIAEFDCRFVWNKILENRSFDSHIQDLLYGLVKRYALSGLQKHPLWVGREAYFMALLAALADMQSQNSIPEKDSVFSMLDGEKEESVLEHVQSKVVLFLDRLTDICSTDSIKDALPEIRQQSLLQCVYVYCRNGRYKEAETFFEANKAEFDKETNRKAEAVIRAKKKPHRFLESETYENYLQMMIKFLEAVRETFPDPPFLLQLAEDFETLPRGYQNRTTSSSHDIGPVSDGDSDSLELEEQVASIRKKVRQQVQQKIGRSPSRLVSPAKRGLDVGDVARSHSPRKRVSHSRQNGESDESVNGSVSRSASDDESHMQGVDIDDFDSFEADSTIQRGSPSRPKILPSVKLRRSLAPQQKVRLRVKSAYRQRWTDREEEEFYLLVQKYGVGAWADIKSVWPTTRTGVMLKDKWRTILKSSYKELCKKFGPADLPPEQND